MSGVICQWDYLIAGVPISASYSFISQINLENKTKMALLWGKNIKSSTFLRFKCDKINFESFFEGIDLSDFFCSFAVVLLWISSTNE